ncbi:MAG: CHAT domain-containing tetratricopeptide repeat protein [Leptolyngbyaceae cyanobacterium bins.302]|nr:CHAT domain-containing tetratricopeptide repeat protein [Leptolyngbyaceae cyanobacterium bins.302]
MNIHQISFSTIATLALVSLPSTIAAAPLPSSPNPTEAAIEQLLQQGTDQYEAEQFVAAIQTWQQARKTAQHLQSRQQEVAALTHLGRAYVRLERYQEAIAVLEDGLPLAQSLQNQSLAAQALGNLGIAYQELGNYAKAITTHRQAGKLMLELGDRQGLGQVLTNLGNTFEAVGDYSNATIAFQQSLKIAQQTGDRIGESVALGNLGAIYANQGKDQDAIAALQQSLDLAKANDYLSGQASALLNLGSSYHSLQKVDQAISFYQQGLKLAQTMGDRQREAEALGALGLAYEDQKQFSAAIQHHEKSLAIGRSLKNPELQGRALNNLGHALYNSGKFQQAETVLRQAIQLLDALRPGLNDSYKVSIFDTQLHTYSLLQQVLVAAKKYDAALEAAEWGRARAFAERLARRVKGGNSKAQQNSRQTQAVVPNSSLPTVAPIRIADIRRIAREQKATLVEYAIVTDDDFKFRGKQRGREAELLIWVVQPTGRLHFRRVDLKPLWQQNLSLAKLVMAGRNCLFPGGDCQGVAPPATQPTPDRGQTRTNETSAPAPSDSSKPQRRVNPALHHLHQLLIQPIADLLPKNPQERILLLPLESLFLVPFPALQTADGTYLVEQHTVLTAPAIQVLALTRQIKQQQAVKATGADRFLPALIVGNPAMPMVGSEQLSPLPASQDEAQQIAQLLKTKALIGQDATQAKVVKQMAQAALVHLATHGLLEYGEAIGETDLPGAIALAPNPSSASENTPNGILTASEILDLPLRASLVVLSACDTGRGRITGDGVQGLSRAFISAGVPSLVVSLWAVSDASTAHLMVHFYENLLRQPDKAKALRYAMLETMKQYPRPLDWAAFTLIGEAE